MFKTVFFIFTMICGLFGCVTQSEPEQWMTLFNGKDLDDWVVKINHHETGNNYGNTFRVEDGLLKVRYDQYDFVDEFGHIFYKTPFKNFHLRVDYRFSGQFEKGGPDHAILNSGVMFHSQSAASIHQHQDWPVSVEMQLLADLGDGKRMTGNMCSPGTNIVFEGEIYPEHCLSSTHPALGKDQWVRAELVVEGDSVTQLINGQIVLLYSHPTIDGNDRIVKGQRQEFQVDGQVLTSGYIALQSEGQPIEFKNVQIKELE
tara:strand:+ start:36321 stop:37097 length:777 start_codon:yes stop_codon:yes gene_type:complete